MPETMDISSRSKVYTLEFVKDFPIHFRGLFSNPNTFFLIDQRIYQLYGSFFASLSFGERLILLQASEGNKTVTTCEKVIGRLIANKVNKRSILVVVGGGILQDIGAFASSILFRGIEWVFFPTTLLAQADSCIGGKTSINFKKFKNLLGNFYPPSRVFIDVNFLNTLSGNDIKSGIGEILHFYFFANSPYINRLYKGYEGLFHDRKKLIPYIHESLRIKKSVIEKDEFDKGLRNLFNYGHTFGHALESVTEYKIPHGQAVTVGMDLANYISFKRNLISEGLFLKRHQILVKNMPPRPPRSFSIKKYIKALSKDKKNVNSNLTCILILGDGKMEKKQIPMDEQLLSSIKEYFDQF